ncbi:MAG: O-antigen ligase family protein [Desulfosporosinus sp.]|nr:O-antigen ligase family protein [Desulfosporosinus sp.]
MSALVLKKFAKRITGQFCLNSLILLAIALVLILAPLFRGLYYDQEALYFMSGVGLITGCVAYLKKRSSEVLDLTDLALGCLTAWYIIAIPFSVNKGDAIIGSMRILGYVALYYAASRSLSEKTVHMGGWLLASTGVLVTYIGIGSSINLPSVLGSWGNVLSSTFQYHNAFGGYLLMVVPITLLLYRDADIWWKRYLAVTALYIVFLGLLGSQSRGAYIFLLIELLLSLLAFNKKNVSLFTLIIVGIWAAMDGWPYVFGAGNLKSLMVIVWPLAWVGPVWLTEWIWHGIKDKAPRRMLQLAGVGLVLALLVYGTLPLVVRPPAVLTNHPPVAQGASVVARAQSIDVSDISFQTRLQFYRDALKMGLSHPLLGFGANGWMSAYKGYQGILYYAKEVHSEPFKILVETGFPGLLLYILFWLGVLQSWVQSWRFRCCQPDYLLGVAAAGIFLHSLIDYDLSESAVFFTMIVIVASLRALREDNVHHHRAVAQSEIIEQKRWSGLLIPQWSVKRGWLVSAIMGLSALTLVFGSLSLEAGLQYTRYGTKAFNVGQYNNARRDYRMALTYNPFQATTYADLAQMEMAQAIKMKNTTLVSEALNDINHAIILNSTEPRVRSVAAQINAAAGKPDQAYAQAMQNMELAPFNSSGYEGVAEYGIQWAERLISQGKMAEAQPILLTVQDLPLRINALLAKVSPHQKMLEEFEHLTVTPRLKLLVAQAKLLMSEPTLALKPLNTKVGLSVATAATDQPVSDFVMRQ